MVVAQQVVQGLAATRGLGNQQDAARISIQVVNKLSGWLLCLGLQQQLWW